MVMSTPLTLHHPILQLFVRFPLRLSRPSLGGDIMISHSQGSFQRDSAGAGHSCHRFRLHDRRASCPFSGAVRRSRLPGIVSFHRHSPPEGCGPSCPEMWSGVRPAAYCTQMGWRQIHRRHPLYVKEEKGMEREWERRGIRSHTPILK